MAKAQGQLPGMPEPRPGIWPDYEFLGREAMRVYRVELSLTGSKKLEAGDEIDEALAKELYMGAGQAMQISFKVTKTGHKLDGDEAVGTVVGVLDYMVPAEDGAAVRFLALLGEYRSHARTVEGAANQLSDELGRLLKARVAAGQSVPTALEDAHDNLRAEIDHLRAIG